MIKNIVALLALLTLTGCGSYSSGFQIYDWGIYVRPLGYIPAGSIDAEMQGYIDTFKKEATARNVSTNYSNLSAISWQDNITQGGQTLWGYCQVYNEPDGSKRSEIVLSKMLRAADPVIMTLIITHELGHCLLGVGHTSHDTSMQLQIMYWSSGWAQQDNIVNYKDPVIWGGYLDFLFQQQSQEVSP